MTDPLYESDPGSLFARMEEQEAGAEGYYQRRVPATSSCIIHVGVRKPSNLRLVRFSFSVSALPEDYDLPGFRTLRLTCVTENSGSAPRETITLQADQEAFNEVFTHLVQDIITRTAREKSESDAARVLRSRLILWQRLLQRDRVSGLTPEEQRGLYGELHTLEKILLPTLGPAAAVQSWTGPPGAAQDFQMPGGIALEVKTSLKRAPHEIAISSEVQLDDYGLQGLYLCHVLIDAQHGTGESLPERVASVRATLTALDVSAADVFEDLLLEAGYSPASNPEVLYRDPGYTFRGAPLYHVHGNFPRIVRANLPAGVGTVSYLIATDACKEFEESWPDFLKIITPPGEPDA